ncbi:Hypothetical predicted protein [Olea europaea subsp. europaea]|uniref:Protein TIFY n=1 Tax=Olea europaea subsp. europaea TaxID=158383 RepID=A0A8S0T0V2_OLEEU|nr:Hypothetical predicted protein [Olea europaea subsp. europaea]
MSCSSTAAREFTTKKVNSSENMAESNDSFQKCHLTKILRRIQKSTNKTRRGETRKAPPGLRPLVPSKFGGGFRYPTLLKQQLLPMMIKGDGAVAALSSDKSEGEQLTIFYNGVINVYENVSVDKAKAIMLLAGENSVSAPVVEDTSNISQKSPVCKLQPNLPIATKRSLELFFNKRRDRLMNRIALVPTSDAQLEDDSQTQEKLLA